MTDSPPVSPTNSGQRVAGAIIDRDEFFIASLGECERAGISDERTRLAVEFKLRSQRYWEINKPWIDIIVRLHAAKQPVFRLAQDGSISATEYQWNAKEQALLDEARKGLAWCAEQCGIALENSP